MFGKEKVSRVKAMWIKFIDDRFELYEMALICSSEFTDFESSIRVIDLGILSSMCIYHSFQNTRKNIFSLTSIDPQTIFFVVH